MFKIIFRTFETEILRKFKNIQSQPKNETFLLKRVHKWFKMFADHEDP